MEFFDRYVIYSTYISGFVAVVSFEFVNACY